MEADSANALGGGKGIGFVPTRQAEVLCHLVAFLFVLIFFIFR